MVIQSHQDLIHLIKNLVFKFYLIIFYLIYSDSSVFEGIVIFIWRYYDDIAAYVKKKLIQFCRLGFNNYDIKS